MVDEVLDGAFLVDRQIPLRLLFQHLQDFDGLARFLQGNLDIPGRGVSLTRHLVQRYLRQVADEIIESDRTGILRRRARFRSGWRGFRPPQFRGRKIGQPALSAGIERAAVRHLDFFGRGFRVCWHHLSFETARFVLEVCSRPARAALDVSIPASGNSRRTLPGLEGLDRLPPLSWTVSTREHAWVRLWNICCPSWIGFGDRRAVRGTANRPSTRSGCSSWRRPMKFWTPWTRKPPTPSRKSLAIYSFKSSSRAGLPRSWAGSISSKSPRPSPKSWCDAIPMSLESRD